jgi:hypothetical protein
MQSIPSEIRLQEFWKYLSYEEIVNLCQTNIEFNKICQSNALWQHLLYRDFGIVYNEPNARESYLKYKATLDHFSQFYPIITQHALQALMTFIPVSEWLIYDDEIIINREMYDYNPLYTSILSVNRVANLIHDIKQSGNLWYLVREITINAIGIDNYNQIIQKLVQSNCNQLERLIKRPTIIFVRKNLIVIDYDYDLAFQLLAELQPRNRKAYHICNQKVDQMTNNLLELIK